jgi:hypothetical protein
MSVASRLVNGCHCDPFAMDLVMHLLPLPATSEVLSFLFRRTSLDVSLHGLEKSSSDLPKGADPFKVVLARNEHVKGLTWSCQVGAKYFNATVRNRRRRQSRAVERIRVQVRYKSGWNRLADDQEISSRKRKYKISTTRNSGLLLAATP